ncbi:MULTISPECIES: carbohydrate ABC transporter permease [Rhizobium/Agrobacterium group]|jgi:multiple sugar transport system permease protein|uniref:Carbohydrate ABC transporter permease n=2 Tax=Rhizobium/Agrobacterium group TaxID=227290 RepID=A0A1B9TBN7_AGRTU|nr:MULTISPECIES: carbohydrate ABC transporter permease [Rhizobium/Agrobacterium group]AHK02925.1 glycerol-3-phosphate ABC transporter, permease protein UgpE [Agrobacterium tumefaciens LBA4213 (Ach5)]AKC08718.1 multiple sugar transport system permease protein [Agrobacterium tumefaciens]MDP9561892.1 multiple sugar transport system permease protein [Rhizobium nepotum]AYM12499.1 multiple sugar transport system permease protein [Agrobacterium tumefaciens]AYM17860.1 multiple sugar transport system p
MSLTKRLENVILTLLTFSAALVWIFPLYWGFVTSLRSDENVAGNTSLLPDEFQLGAYVNAIFNTRLLTWYVNSIGTAAIVTVSVLIISMLCAYALSQIRFPGRRLLYGIVLASFMVPAQTLVVTQFILMKNLNLINTWAGIILPQLITPIVIIVYKQFFDSVPKEMREAVVLDGGGEYTILFKVFLPLNWGITTAMAIVTFITVWNAFFWPFLVITSENMMTIPVGITQVNDTFGIVYARLMAIAMLAALPVIVAYVIFQRRVTEAIMISSGVKG